MSAPWISAFPTRGPWTPLGVPRGWFLGILAGSIVAFALIGGPVWRDPHGEHFLRIALSYAIIPLGTACAVRRERPFPFGRVVAATAVLSLIKLVATATLLGLIVLGHG